MNNVEEMSRQLITVIRKGQTDDKKIKEIVTMAFEFGMLVKTPRGEYNKDYNKSKY